MNIADTCRIIGTSEPEDNEQQLSTVRDMIRNDLGVFSVLEGKTQPRDIRARIELELED